MSKATEQDIAFIRALAETLREHDLSEIEVSREYGDDDELKVRLSRQIGVAAPQPAAAPPAPPAPAAAPPAPAEPAPAAHPAPAEPEGDAVTSPMVGTAYLAPEPGAEPFVRAGDEVAEGQTLLIIEAMKTMNQIPSPRAGRVVAVKVANGEPVEYGAPLVTLA
jgi:acetyl-CoA carboxylase biotin carboxyl carrier protein